ncbi:MAG: sporulation protein YhbH [Planctomycetota bacterium]
MAVRRIDQDHTRFRHIVKGRIKRDLKKYVSSGELIGKQGKRFVSIPLPSINLPRFRFGKNEDGGVGQGEGEEGQPTPSQPGDEPGQGQAGENSGEHSIEVDVPLEDLAQILGEELELPNIEPRGNKNLQTQAGRYTGISRVGPMSLRHFKRTFKEALKRQIASGTYDPDNPVIVPIKEDLRFRALQSRKQPEASAVVIYMMDVSGSMGREQKETVRIEAFWIDTWLRHQYKNLEVRYIVHDATATEVDQHTFFHLRESGGTKISSAYELALQIIRDKYPPSEWNIYPFHFSDGDNWSTRDTEHCLGLLKDSLLPMCNQFCYGQVKSSYGSGQFKKDLDGAFRGDEKVVTTDILDRDGILPSIKSFLGKGR